MTALLAGDLSRSAPLNDCVAFARSRSRSRACCRTEYLEEDFKKLVATINAQRRADLPPLADTLLTKNQGPTTRNATGEDGGGVPRSDRHKGKYELCGSKCLLLAQQTYADDFRLLQFPKFGEPA